MARVGNTNSNGKENIKGSLYFGDKDKEYLIKSSRQAVEEHHNFSVTYLEIDWLNSKKNLYGEIEEVNFVYPQGIKIQCKYSVNQNNIEKENNLFKKTNKLTVSLYDEQLNEKGVKIKRGDYFLIGKRIYRIYDYTINDEEGVGVALGGKKIRTDVFAYEESDEVLKNTNWNEKIKQL